MIWKLTESTRLRVRIYLPNPIGLSGLTRKLCFSSDALIVIAYQENLGINRYLNLSVSFDSYLK